MHTLTLMRHAKSSWDDTALGDHERSLNERGRKAAKTMAGRLKESGYRPDLVIVSSAQRARETADVLQKRYKGKLEIHTEAALYEAAAQAYAEVIRHVDEDVKALMIIGNNPTIEWIAERLGGHEILMPTAAYIRVEIPHAWREFTFEPAKVLDYDFPKSGR